MKSYCIAGLLIGTSFLASCDRKPTACIEVPQAIVQPGIAQELQNCSDQADSWFWDLGNGTTSELPTPRVIYDTVGTYQITLFAISKNGYKIDSAFTTIEVKQRVLDRIVLTQFPALQSTGFSWDPDVSGPDLFWQAQFSETAQSISPVIENAMQSQLPLTWDLSDSTLVMPDRNLRFILSDQDPGSSQQLAFSDFNPTLGPNPTTFVVGDVEATFHYRLE